MMTYNGYVASLLVIFCINTTYFIQLVEKIVGNNALHLLTNNT